MDVKKLKAQLIQHEGLRLKPYRCSAGKLTIGVGRNLDDKGITEQEALSMLDDDIKDCLDACEDLFPAWDRLGDLRQRALIDMCFNLGARGLKKFVKMIAAVNEGDFYQAAEEMQDSVWCTQVKTRVKTLVQMMLIGERR